MSEYVIERVTPADLSDVLALMRAYCDFYAVSPSDQDLLALAQALVADPEREGLQLIVRGPAGAAVGFATIFWTWSTTDGGRIGIMNDLFLRESARGQGLAERLIEVCRVQCGNHGARRLTWQTAPENHRAQTVYDRVGAIREQWVDYWLET
jgi:GNAT superfamily N-acetyltransferase